MQGAGSGGLILGQVTKIPHGAQHGQNIKKISRWCEYINYSDDCTPVNGLKVIEWMLRIGEYYVNSL